MNMKPFRQVVGTFRMATRRDISFSVGELARHVTNPELLHWIACKRVCAYLNGTAEILGLNFNGKTTNDQILAFSDADCAGDIDTRKSRTGITIEFH